MHLLFAWFIRRTIPEQVADEEKKVKAREKAKKKEAKAELAKAKEEKRLLQEKEGFKRWEFNESEFVTKNFRKYLASPTLRIRVF